MALEGGSSGLVEKMQNRAKFSGFVTISLPVISLKNCVDEFGKAENTSFVPLFESKAFSSVL